MPDIKIPKIKKAMDGAGNEPVQEITPKPASKEEDLVEVEKDFSQPLVSPALSTKTISMPTRPVLEGINSAPQEKPDEKVSASLTAAEEKLIKSSDAPAPVFKKIFEKPPTMTQDAKNSSKGGGLWMFLFALVLLGLSGYFFYQQGYRVVVENINNAQMASEIGKNINEDADFQKWYDSASSGSNAAETPTVTPTESPSATPASLTTDKILINQIKITSTPTGYLNVRKTPSTSGALVSKVYPGEVYHFLSSENGWYKISLKDGTPGWISGQYTEKVPAP